MSENHLAFIFPAFTSDYTDHPARKMPGFEVRFNDLLLRAARFIDPELAGFNFNGNTFPDDELRTQYLTYIYSCAASFLLRKNSLIPSMNAGYSMGIYAALVDSEAISFETGLALIRTAYHSLRKSLNNASFSMGSLIGLSREDILQLIEQSSLRVEITNQNASHSFVISGYRDDIQLFMKLATAEGALHTRDLAVSIPYHSGYLKEGAMHFADQISPLKIGTPKTPTISLINQMMMTSPEKTREEIVRNLFHPINWFQSMNMMLDQKVKQFIECGPSKGLAKNARFVDGNFLFSTLNAIPFPAVLP